MLFAGSNVAFVAAATGTPAPTVQWQVSTNGDASACARNCHGLLGIVLHLQANDLTATHNSFPRLATYSRRFVLIVG